MHRALLLALLAAAAAPAAAQTRPFLTEEAATGPAGRLLLEAGGEVMRAEPNFLTGEERTRGDLPQLRLVWSPSDNVEIDLEWTARVLAWNDPGYGDVSDFGDVAVRAKMRFLEERGRAPAFGARLTVWLPQTSFGNGLGPNTLRMSAQALLGKSFGQAALQVNAGLLLFDEPLRAHEQRDFFAYGALLTRRLGPRFAAGVEVAGRLGDGMPGAEQRSEARLGLRFGEGRLGADAALRRGLAEADGTWGLTAGLTWRLRDTPP